MQKKIGLTFFFLICLFLPIVFATQTISNISPAPPSIVEGIQPIIFNYTDSTNNQIQNCSIYTSNPAGLRTTLITSDDCNSLCDFQTGSIGEQLSKINLGVSTINTLFSLDGNLNLATTTGAGLIFYSYDFGTNTWIENEKMRNFPFSLASTTLQSVSFINNEPSTSQLFLTSTSTLPDHTPASHLISLDWNGSGWDNRQDQNLNQSGVDVSTNNRIVKFNGSLYLFAHAMRAWVYNPSNALWERNDALVTGLENVDCAITPLTGMAFDLYVDNSQLNILSLNVSTTCDPEPFPYLITYGYQKSSSSLWSFNNSWANVLQDIEGHGTPYYNPIYNPSTTTHNNILYTVYRSTVAPAGTYLIKRITNGTRYSTQGTCTYNWDTTLVNAGNYYIDVNINNGTTTQQASGSSFLVNQNFYSDITITDIQNITHQVDKNVINLYPTDSTKDFKFSLQSNGFLGTAFFKIYNTDKSLKQYFAWTCDDQNCATSNYSFDDTITYGSGNYAAIQKIWNNAGAFNYTLTDSILSDTNKSYWFKYNSTMKSWFSLSGSSDWDVGFLPTVTDYNGISRDLFTPTNVVPNEINNTLIDSLPVITTNLSNANFVFQFNAFSDSTTTSVLKVDTVANPTANPTRKYTTTTKETRITVKDLNQNYLRMITNSTSANVFTLGLYNLIERGYFTKDLQIKDAANNDLSVYLENQVNYPYLPEGKSFRILTQVNDPNHNLSYYEVTVYVDSIDPANKIKYYKKYFDTNQAIIELNDMFDGVIDLTPGAANRNVRVAVRVYEKGGLYSEVQSRVFKLLQFPYFPGDFSIKTTLLNKVVGQAPKGRITIRDIVPETLRGVNLYIYQAANSPANNDYNKTFYIDRDFVCNGFDCSFDFELKDWLFPKQQASKLTVSALLTTQNEDYNSSITAHTLNFFSFWKEFDYARIVETIERQPGDPNHVYNNTEQIPLTLQLRDTDLANLKNDLEIYMLTATCGAATGNCIWQDVNYSPSGYIYDPKTGFNYWFWKNVFFDANGELFSDGSFHQFKAIVADKKNTHQNNISVFLTHKCIDYFPTCGWLEAITSFGLACFTPQKLGELLDVCDAPTAAMVTEAQYPSAIDYNFRIEIDATYSPTPPTQELAYCINTDQNNVYQNSLEQEIICGSYYRLNEAAIDKFDFYLANPYSDFSKDEKSRQYIKITVPAEIIEFNDLSLMRQFLSDKYHTKPTNFGELLWMAINSVAAPIGNTLAPGLDNIFCKNAYGVTDQNCMTGIIPNLGFDFNFAHPLDPTYINGLLIFKLKGIKVLNQQDFVSKYPDLNAVNPKDFIEYMQYKGRTYAKNKVKVEILGSDMIPLMEQEVASPLIINTPLSATLLKKQSQNNQTQFESIPTALPFNAIIDLSYNGETQTIRRYIQFVLTAFIYENNAVGGIGQFLMQNWFFFLIAILMIFAAARVYAWVKPGNNG